MSMVGAIIIYNPAHALTCLFPLESPMNLEKRPPKVEHAEVRSTVVLRCNADHYPATFHWSKEQGTINPDQDITSVR